MNIRLAAAGDVRILAELRFKMRQERETAACPISDEEFMQNNIDYFAAALSDGSYVGVIAEADGEIVGTGGICFHNHPPSYSVPNGKTACLLNMYTLPSARGKGVAGRIVEFLVGYARRQNCCQVTLNASAKGKPLYEKFGFKDVANEMVFDLLK